MRYQKDLFNKSSFLSLEKDAQIIVTRMLGNENLKKLLYYSNKECLDTHKDISQMPIIGQEETYSLVNNQIKLIPKIYADEKAVSYIIIDFNDFIPTENPEFRDNTIIFNVLCHFDEWNLGNFRLRPYKIAGEIDGMFNNAHLSGIGTLQFLGGNQLSFNKEYGGISLFYTATHGTGEDQN